MQVVSEASPPPELPPQPVSLRVRYRIRFAKTGLLRWISHRDLARLWERLVRRAELPLSMSEGFHPKPRIGFPSALALGVESHDEVVELELAENLSPQWLLETLQSDRQPGLAIHSVKRLPSGFGKAQLLRSDYRITLPDSTDFESVQAAIDRLTSTETVSVDRKKKTVTVHVASQILLLEIRDGRLRLGLAASDTASLRPGDVLDLLGLEKWTDRGATITRTGVTLEKEYEPEDPRQCARASAGPTLETGSHRSDAAAGASLPAEGRRCHTASPAGARLPEQSS